MTGGRAVILSRLPKCPAGAARGHTKRRGAEREHGRIVKKWSGLGKEWMSDADNFSVSFNRELEPDVKLLCLGACFLIDDTDIYLHLTQNGHGIGRCFGPVNGCFARQLVT